MTLRLKEIGVCGLDRGKGLRLWAFLRRIGNRSGSSKLAMHILYVARQVIDWIYLRKILPFWPTLPTVKCPAFLPGGRASSGPRCVWDRCSWCRKISWLSLARRPAVFSRAAFSSRFRLIMLPPWATVFARRRFEAFWGPGRFKGSSLI